MGTSRGHPWPEPDQTLHRAKPNPFSGCMGLDLGQDTASSDFPESWLFTGTWESWQDLELRSLLLNEAGSDCQGVCIASFFWRVLIFVPFACERI